jgi:opacity protein-like surface antigen
VVILRHRNGAGKRQECGFPFLTMLVLAAAIGIETVVPVLVHAETTFIPSATVSGRYDTNVWFTPQEFLPPGTRLDDFATSVGGYGQLLYRERDIEASLTGGVDYNAFVYNPGLNFITTRLDGKAKLDGWIQRLAKGAQLRVAESFRYTPETPAFLTGVKAGVVEDPFLRGIQQFRANTFANVTSVNASLPLFRDLWLDGRYAFALTRFGSVLAAGATGAAFFDTTMHTWSAGPRYRLTRQDNLSVLYQQSMVTQTRSSDTGAPDLDFTTHSLSGSYDRDMEDWTAGVTGGVTVIDPPRQGYPTGTIRLSTNPERVTAVRLDLSRKASPSLFFVAGALISNVGTLAVSHKLSRLLSLQGTLAYGYNETVPDRTVKFTSITANAGVNYKLTKTVSVDLYYSYNDFKTEQPGSTIAVLRNVVGFSLTAEWK